MENKTVKHGRNAAKARRSRTRSKAKQPRARVKTAVKYYIHYYDRRGGFAA